MYIHNFFADVLLSVRTLFDQYVFGRDNFIKRYEFSVGNRTFALGRDYETNFEFPVVLVSLGQDLYPFSKRAVTAQLRLTDNTNLIPVLYNRTNKKALYLQEEFLSVPLDITVNCESQFSAKEIENEVKKFLPMDKMIQFLSFTSFLEIPPELLTREHFDVANHDIVNLFTKFNRHLDRTYYCFSVNYRPFLRLESSTVGVTDMSSRSFSAVFSLVYFLPFPEYLVLEKDAVIFRITLDYGRIGTDPIVAYPLQSLVSPKAVPDDWDGYRCVRNYLIYFDEPPVISYTDEHVLVKLAVGDLDTVRLTEATRFQMFSPRGKLHRDLGSLLVDLFIETTENFAVFKFTRQVFTNYFAGVSLTSPLIIRVFQPL